MSETRRILVTGGAGFIGSAVCRHLVRAGYHVVNVDKLTYAGNLASLREIETKPNYRFVKGDICDERLMREIMAGGGVDAVMHLAAESHVDRSIDGSAAFVETNVVGTFRLLGAALEYWRALPAEDRDRFRFHHISTDEVFGDLPFDSWHIHRGDTLCALLALFGLESGFRPLRAILARDLRPARGGD